MHHAWLFSSQNKNLKLILYVEKIRITKFILMKWNKEQLLEYKSVRTCMSSMGRWQVHKLKLFICLSSYIM